MNSADTENSCDETRRVRAMAVLLFPYLDLVVSGDGAHGEGIAVFVSFVCY
jgi:hypothetical protein